MLERFDLGLRLTAAADPALRFGSEEYSGREVVNGGDALCSASVEPGRF
jgi:hypothetical protein